MTIPAATTAVALRLALASLFQIDVEQVRAAIGHLTVDDVSPAHGIRSSFEPATRTTTLYASSVLEGQELRAATEELLRWHGAAAAPAGWASDLADEVKAWADAPHGCFEREIHDAVMGAGLANDPAAVVVARTAFEAVRRDANQAPWGAVRVWRDRLQQCLEDACEALLGTVVPLAGRDQLVTMTRALAGLPHEPMMGRIWWSADTSEEAEAMRVEYSSKGASVELGDGDRHISVFITMDRAIASHVLGYQPEEGEWMLEGEDVAPTRSQDAAPATVRDHAGLER
ncbi:hypothetical protein [Paracidovorax wautersii]|uniref:Uncharacterized protein n=1 Tax=Paracidovorax wautersii TaxID=1177982 RepID=A0A1I2HVG9_9BURK|nr:hypothetical protein [Paracidovorax wautersii]SFF32371.1 hypothetical protein SAMN04489711_1307 [Paracidovorax wautersii]